jgi:AbiV family abortive infection protein
MKLQASFVLEGAVLAASNARRFLDDTIYLYQAKRYGSAHITGILAIENVGRGWRILRQILENSLDPSTGQLTVKTEVDGKQFSNNIRQDHHQTIRTGIMSLQFGATSDIDMTEFDKWVKEAQLFSVGTPQHAKAVKKLKRAGEKVFNNTTTDWHLARTIEQYVEPNVTGTSWNEPQSATRQQIHDLIINGYNNHRMLVIQIRSHKLLVNMLSQKALEGLQALPLPLLEGSS